MIKRLLLAVLSVLLFLAAVPSSTKTIQVTIGAATTAVVTTNTYCRQLFLQNNQTHNMRVGDSTTSATKGILLALGSPGGSITVTAPTNSMLDESDWFVNGTQNDVLDATCTQ